MGELDGKHVVITGGTGALGTDVTLALVEAGASCHVSAFPGQSLESWPLRDHDHVTVEVGIDLSDEDSVVEWYGSLPPLWASVNIAGGFAMGGVCETSMKDFRAMLDMNAATAFLCSREAVRSMRAGGQGGRIVNVGARPAVLPTAGMIAYSTSKAAVTALTAALAEEVVGEGILVNAILPSVMDTPGNRAAMPKADHGSWPSTLDIASVVRWLVSPDNAVVRGGLIPVYGKA